MEVIWQGTDSLLLIKFPKQMRWWEYWYVIKIRIFARLLDRKTQCHYYHGELVRRNLEKFGMKKPLKHIDSQFKYGKLNRLPHEGFNVLYYFPQKSSEFTKWLYGLDIFLSIRRQLREKNINFCVVDGTFDMGIVYPTIDLLIRPNRHDGYPRMVRTCEINGIPFIWTAENPTVEYFVNKIMEIYESKKNI